MKAKKLIAGILAGTMVLSSAVTASAATATTLGTGTLECGNFWANRTSGIAIKDSVVTLTFTAKGDVTAVYQNPIYIVYSSTDGNSYNGGPSDTDADAQKSYETGLTKNYKEYLVCRGDVYAWTSAGGTSWGSDGIATPNTLGDGYGFTGTAPAVDEGTSWTDYFMSQVKAGTTGTITAYYSNKNVIVNYKIAGAESTATIPVSSASNLYLGLTGENCKITNMKYSYATVSQNDVKVSVNKTSFTYNGKVRKPTVTVKDKNGKAIASSNYTIKYSNKNSKKAGSYTVTVSFKNDYKGIVDREFTYTINKATQKVTAQLSSNTIKLKKIKKNKQTVSLYVKGNKTSLSITPSDKKKVTVKKVKAVKSGKWKGYTKYTVTVKKTTKKTTYSIKVYAKSTANYSQSASKTVKIKVK